ncbi:hypothetical protein [Halobaculum sp. EA56]|uniref:hypothetical protein n=1 Tax=Halobaculum sp. EA56 TaxID=3421648 RepID=UPI003EB9DCD8
MSDRNVIEEVEARIAYVPRWRLVLGVVLLVPPATVLGMALLGYELYRAGERLRAAEGESLVADGASHATDASPAPGGDGGGERATGGGDGDGAEAEGETGAEPDADGR